MSVTSKFRGARRWLSKLKPPRRLKLTREGKYFIAITFGVGFVGILTANNLLYVLLGILLSLIVVSGLLSEASLRHLRVTRKLPLRAQVGRPHQVEIEVHNDKEKMPSYAIEVEDLRAGQPADKRCFFLKVSPGASQVAAYRRIPGRRGLDQHTGFRVATRFPFGFFEKSREFQEKGDLIIYPGVDQVQLPKSEGGTHMPGGRSIRRGSGDEILGLRVMREGDDPRDIYWKRSTAGDTKIVMERATEVLSHADLNLDDLLSDDAEASVERSRLFERHVRETASLAVAHLRRGEPITIHTSSGERLFADPSEGADTTLRFLALIDFSRERASDSPARVHLARSEKTTRAYRRKHQSVVMAPIHLSRPAEPPGLAPSPPERNSEEEGG